MERDPSTLVGYVPDNWTSCACSTLIKLGENFWRKARYCADGHKIGAPASVTYNMVNSSNSMRILQIFGCFELFGCIQSRSSEGFLDSIKQREILDGSWSRIWENFLWWVFNHPWLTHMYGDVQLRSPQMETCSTSMLRCLLITSWPYLARRTSNISEDHARYVY